MLGLRYAQLPRAVSRPSLIARNIRLYPRRPNSTSAAPPSKPPSFFKLTHLWYGLVLATGASAGYALRQFAAPLPLPIPGSKEDELALRALVKDVDKLEIVTFMRSQCPPKTTETLSHTPLSTPDDEKTAWTELEVKRSITEAAEDMDKPTQIVTRRTLAGSQGLGIQRAFWNAETKEMVAVVWIGGALSGWPSLAHGGAIATIFEDVMSRMVAGPDVSIDSVPGPTSMSVTYARPTHILNFYILRANFSNPRIPPIVPPPSEPAQPKSWLPFWKDLTKKEPYTGAQPSVEIVGTLESVKGVLCIRAKGTFPITAA